ncbi:MAG: dTDP-4-dehydrorhamnose reductase [Edaphobacter sp.]|nr:dTDP-4-dehydrorhamnose reductase [Edaphobacter sp.]
MNLSRPKSLLIGASGQIGSQMLRALGRERCLVTSRKSSSDTELVLDLATLATLADVEHIFDGYSIDAIYCLAGLTNVECCEDVPELAHNTNCRGPELLAQFAKARNLPLVYFSTEYIFDGNHGPYNEEDTANPLNVYGKSKWEGERAVLAACSRAVILRTTVVYGQDFGEKNYIYSLMRSLGAGKPMRVPEDQISTPTYNRDLAKAAIALVERGATGIFHVCGPERMDRLEFARSVAAFLGLDVNLLQGLPTSALGQKAPRPLSAGLSIAKLTRLHPDLTMRTASEGLADCHSDLEDFLRSCATLT